MCRNNWFEELENRFQKDIQAIEDGYKETEIDFQIWKSAEYRRITNEFREMTVILEEEIIVEVDENEYCEYCTDGMPVHDDWVLDRECVGTIQSESDVSGDDQEDDRGDEESDDYDDYDYTVIEDEEPDIYGGFVRVKSKYPNVKKKRKHKKHGHR